MNNIKLIWDGKVVDAIKNPCYVRYVPRLKMFLACSEDQANGVASRDGTTYWHLEGCRQFGVDGYTTVSPVFISDEEADALIAELEAGKEPADTDGDTGIGEETNPEEVLSVAALYAKVSALEEVLLAAKILLGVE
jgi:hypothetical protein